MLQKYFFDAVYLKIKGKLFDKHTSFNVCVYVCALFFPFLIAFRYTVIYFNNMANSKHIPRLQSVKRREIVTFPIDYLFFAALSRAECNIFPENKFVTGKDLSSCF